MLTDELDRRYELTILLELADRVQNLFRGNGPGMDSFHSAFHFSGCLLLLFLRKRFICRSLD
ncbi:hypothetical protein D3C76_1802430 [compost metagenome]